MKLEILNLKLVRKKKVTRIAKTILTYNKKGTKN